MIEIGLEKLRMENAKLIYGYHAILSRLQESPETFKKILVDKSKGSRRALDIIHFAQQKNVEIEWMSSHNLDLTTAGAKHQGAVGLLASGIGQKSDLQSIISGTKKPLLLVLDGVTDSRNLGACFRVSEAFGVNAIVTPKDRAASLTPGTLKVASGSAERVNFFQVTNLSRTLRQIKSSGIKLVGVSQTAPTNISKVNLRGKIALVFGGEEKGLRRLTKELCSEFVSIPMLGQIESLNLSVAAGVALYEAMAQRNFNEGSEKAN
ncbi:MAG: 23S rRNA (guanosine(2251)-2'-O)-methyltransferase RlmB [Proteobacteria bacterium]|nr:23S rRNA (guanosine(2251)-2'-O)-methyltransferase RlmB [Pseudomonadota bacterium]